MINAFYETIGYCTEISNTLVYMLHVHMFSYIICYVRKHLYVFVQICLYKLNISGFMYTVHVLHVTCIIHEVSL